MFFNKKNTMKIVWILKFYIDRTTFFEICIKKSFHLTDWYIFIQIKKVWRFE